MSRFFAFSLFGLVWIVGATMALAENSTRVSGYTIHHNAFTTELLSPTVANTYKIRRSKNRGMLNVSVVKDVPGGVGKPVAATVTAVARNLIGQSRPIELREVREGDAVYYIGDFLVSNRELLNFELEVQPAGSDVKQVARLTHEFHTD